MRTLSRFASFALTLVLLAACNRSAAEGGPTPWPQEYLPTVIALTAKAMLPPTATPAPPTATFTPSPTPTTPPPTLDIATLMTIYPTDTPTPTPEPPETAIVIRVPGPMSKVTSPLRVRGYVVPGADGRMQIELLGEDGRLLARNVVRLYGPPGKPVYLSEEISFEIRAAAEMGDLRISTSDEHGRTQALASVHLLLLAVGESEITPAGDYDRCTIFEPSAGATVAGGIVAVRGEFRPLNTLPVTLELVTADGKVVGNRVLTFSGLERQEFSTTIPYRVSEPIQARLILRQDDDRFPGLAYLYSHEVMLYP